MSVSIGASYELDSLAPRVKLENGLIIRHGSDSTINVLLDISGTEQETFACCTHANFINGHPDVVPQSDWDTSVRHTPMASLFQFRLHPFEFLSSRRETTRALLPETISFTMFCVPSEHDDLVDKFPGVFHAKDPNLRAYASHYGGNVKWVYKPAPEARMTIHGTDISTLSTLMHEAYVHDRSMAGVGQRSRPGIVELIAKLADSRGDGGTVELSFDWCEKLEIMDAIQFMWDFVKTHGLCTSVQLVQTFRHREKQVYIDCDGITTDQNLHLLPPKDLVTPPTLRLTQTWNVQQTSWEWSFDAAWTVTSMSGFSNENKPVDPPRKGWAWLL